MRKFLGLVMILIFVLTQVFIVYNVSAVTNTDLLVTVSSQPDTIHNNDTFLTTLRIKNISGAPISKIYLIVTQNSSFFSPGNEPQQVDVSNGGYPNVVGGNLANNTSVDVTIKLGYKGTGKELGITVKYNDGAQDHESTQTFTLNAVPEDTSTPVTVDTKTYKPNLEILGDSDIPTGVAGKKMSITLPIKNSSQYAAKNISITLDTSDLSKIPFKIDKMSLSKTIDQIAPNETKNITFDLNVLDDAANGDYNLKFNFSYINPFNDQMTSSDSIFISIVNNNTPPEIIVSKVEISQQPVVPGQTVKVSFLLKNTGTMNAHDVKATIKGLDSNTFTVFNSVDVQHLGDIAGSDIVTAAYTLEASDNINNGRYGLSLKLDYSSDDKKSYSDDIQFFIRVEKPAEDEAILTLDSIKSPSDGVPIGTDFRIGFNVSNMSKAQAKNIKVSVLCDKEIISKSLNTIEIDSLEANSTKPLEFVLSATSDAVTKNYPIGINLEYDTVQDGKTVRNSVSQYVGVYIQSDKKDAIKTVPRLIISGYNFGGSSKKAGETFDLDLSILNTSKDIPVSNLKITFISDDGTFSIIGSNSFYVETLDTKQQVEKSIKLSAKADATPKAYPLSINFEYEDINGTQYTSKETISIPIVQDMRFVTGDISMSPEAYPGQQAPLNVQFYNMGKTTLYNLMVQVEGDFDGQKSSYFVGNFDPGRSDSFDGTVTPKATGQVKGNIVFTYEDAAGKQTVLKKEFTLNVVQMQMPVQTPDMMKPGMDGQKLPSKKFLGPLSLLQFILILFGLVTVIVVAVILRKRHNRKREMMFDELS